MVDLLSEGGAGAADLVLRLAKELRLGEQLDVTLSAEMLEVFNSN